MFLSILSLLKWSNIGLFKQLRDLATREFVKDKMLRKALHLFLDLLVRKLRRKVFVGNFTKYCPARSMKFTREKSAKKAEKYELKLNKIHPCHLL